MSETTEKYQQAGPKVQPAQKEEMVYTWPYLVSIEAIMAVAMILALSIMSTFVNAPLLDLANGEKTIDPAKAPWYFLGLQELLLHMHPALAGVIVPTAALILVGMIPYIDRDRKGTGIWFSTKNGVAITVFSAVYTFIWEMILILLDEFWVSRTQFQGKELELKGLERHISIALTKMYDLPFLGWDWFGKILLPSIIMVVIPWMLAVTVKKRWKANTRELMIALFTFYFVSFLVLTLVGTAFRGHSMMLMWPWELKPPH